MLSLFFEPFFPQRHYQARSVGNFACLNLESRYAFFFGFFLFLSLVYLVIALTVVPSPLAAGFYTVCFGFALVKAIHAWVLRSSGFAVKA
ncbi:hypothetical protein [Rhodoferax antarcticus]|uniref:hypothetical protein n=1 Tax=Rhodoferax antarcticus TaxID=81479 RepID=UPI000A6413AB|nr:hypothetical protein [Rhodoferax antarcticus]